MSKSCKKCGVIWPLSEFYKHKRMADGHLNFCKRCVRIRVGAHRERNLDRVRAYDRHRGLDPRRKAEAKRYQEENRERVLGYKRSWIERNSEKRTAHKTLYKAVRRGDVTRLPCQICGSSEVVHAHHDDYSKPLEVTWLCPKHHGEVHRRYEYE